MMDISDGLAGDLRHLLHASQAGAELLADAIPISPAACRMARDGRSHKTPLAAALTDGEDFELLFTVASRDAVPLVDAWKQQFPEPALHCIGKVLAEPTVNLRTRDGVRSLTEPGYVHFL
jgi:thiamine-monophosphate kinase